MADALPQDDDELSWKAYGACIDADPLLFFPGRGEPTEPAKAICATCIVQPECFEYGLTQRHGVWGGTSERERRQIRRRRGIRLPALEVPAPTSVDA